MATGNLGKEYDANDEVPRDPFEPIPKGTIVELVMDKSEVRNTKTLHADGEPMGRYIKAEFLVISGPYENKRIFENINFENRNPETGANGEPKGKTTEASAARYLQGLGKATGILRFSDSQDFHGAPFQAELDIEPAKGDFEAKNKIKKFIPLADAPAAAGTRSDAKTTSKPAAPWGKKS